MVANSEEVRKSRKMSLDFRGRGKCQFCFVLCSFAVFKLKWDRYVENCFSSSLSPNEHIMKQYSEICFLKIMFEPSVAVLSPFRSITG